MNELTTTNGAELVTVTAPQPASNPAAIYLASLSAGSRRTMRQALDVIAGVLSTGKYDRDSLPWARVRVQEAAAVRTYLAEHYSPATCNKMLSALRGVLKASAKLVRQAARMSEDPAVSQQARAIQDELADAIGELKPVRGGNADPRGRMLGEGEIRALFQTCMSDDTAAGLRDAAMFGLLFSCGVRRAELAGLDRAALAIDGEDSAWLTVFGKGGKTRRIPVNDGALDALRDWLSVRGDDPGPLFCEVNKGGRVVLTGAHLTSQAVYNMLQKRGEAAGVSNFSPHDFRRTFASKLLDAGADIATVQKLMGHSSVSTTAKYDRRGDRAKQRAVELLHVPYRARRLPGS